MMRSTVVGKDLATCKEGKVAGNDFVTCNDDIGKNGKRGFQHVYKSRKKSSATTQEANKKTLQDGKPNSVHAKRRDYLKKKKLQSLMQVSTSNVHSLGKTLLQDRTKPLFYIGTTMEYSTTLPKCKRECHVLSAIVDLNVIDTTGGAQLVLPNGDTVFTLIPRKFVIEKLKRVHLTMRALYNLEEAQTKAEVRGMKRIPVAEDDGKYTTVGLRPNRASTGITESWPESLDDWSKLKIRQLMIICHEVANAFIPGDEIRGLRSAQLFAKWPTMKGMKCEPIWGSLACGRNYYLNSHTDDDFFYSLTTIVSQYGLELGRFDSYRLDAEVTNYFTFAEQGIAVAVRPGDMLIFNPMYQHCLTSRTLHCQEKDVFCLSLYLKTAIVGGNNNHAP